MNKKYIIYNFKPQYKLEKKFRKKDNQNLSYG